MAKYDYDLLVIGAGSGGVRAARMAGGFGARVAIVEAVRIGGTCVLRGCVPKKLLVYAAQFRDAFEDAVAYGWDAHLPTFDWGRLIANKNRELDRLNAAYIKLLKDADVAMLEGRARLIDPHTVRIGQHAVSAETILIATGSRPHMPDIPGIAHAITSDQALDLPELPRRIVIVGGGYIAVEFAGIFQTLGVEVAMMIRGEELLTGFDDDIRVTLAQEMRKRGVEIHTRCRPAKIVGGEGGATLTDHLGGELSAGLVMFATGRTPNTDNLGLEDVGVKTASGGGIVVDDWLRTNVPNIYALGDVTDRLMLTPVATMEGQRFAEALYGDKPAKPDYTSVPTAVFSQPPVGTVGLSERDARAKFGAVDVYRTSFRPMKHTLTGRDERMMMKLVVEPKSDRVVGAHMVGTDAAEIIQGLAIAYTCGATKAQFDATIGIHPSAAEEFVTLRTKVADPVKEAAE
jgi:glutathione reductase (NADPH)